MVSKLIVTFGILIYAAGVPFLEINDTHVFNPDWTPHARLHEVWQLLTNSLIGLYSLWLVWRRENIRLPSVLGILITGGFLLAYLMRTLYGGSMKHSDGSELTVVGINIGVLAFGIVSVLFFLALLRADRRGNPDTFHHG